MTLQICNGRFRPVIRVFVSSTFSDMKHERNALQADVFPKLEQLCLENGFQFQAIDLRWGVSREAGLDHRTMRICFDELRRAQEISPQPNFLILLGNRYGWRPLPEEISVKEFEELDVMARAVSAGHAAVLHAWYRCDNNAVPPVYLLQSRRQQLPDAKDYTQDAVWNEVQAVLWEIINRAHPPEQLQGRFDAATLAEGSLPAIVRFQASATEQEIWHGLLRVPDAQEHVLAFFRQIENIGQFSEPAQIKDFVDVTPSGSIDAALPAEQERLKTALRTRLDEANVFEARSARLIPARENQGRPAADVTTDHLAQLCSDVEDRLTQIIQGQIEEYWNKTAQSSTERAARELQIEQDEHERFGRERGGEDSFVGRQTELQTILDYVRNKSPWPLVVHGASGCGKTALLARAAEEIQKTAVNGHQPGVIVRFVGVTPHSSDARSLLSSICQQLRINHPCAGELPTDYKALQEELTLQLRSATPEQPLILILDALDQLSDSDNGRQLGWIPTGELLPPVKIIVSCLSDLAEGKPAAQPFVELTRRQLTAKGSVNLDALAEDEARTLLFDRWLQQAGRTVSRDQRKLIEQRLATAICCQPMYLKLLFEEVRLWRSYDKAHELGEDVPALLKQLFNRLSQPANHGRLLVERVLGYLAASRHGLAENEILEVLFADSEYKAALDDATEQTRHELPASATRIPIAIWSRLRFDLAPYLTERAAVGANVLTFYHRQVAEWVRGHYLHPSAQRVLLHQLLADYFQAQADPEKRQCWEQRPRPLSELLYHLSHGEREGELHRLLSQLAFLAARVATGQVYQQLADYAYAGSPLPSALASWYAFLQKHAQRLTQYPTMLVSLVNHEGFPAAQEQIPGLMWPVPWLQTTPEPMPVGDDTSVEGLHVHVTGSITFPWERVSAIASQCSIALTVEQLGVIRVISLLTMHEATYTLTIQRERVLALACAPDATSMVVFYESGTAEFYRCLAESHDVPIRIEPVATFLFHLPETEAPVVVWHEGLYWYQATADKLAAISLAQPQPREDTLAGRQHGELSALVFSAQARLMAIRQGLDTWLFAPGAPPLRRPSADVVTACLCGDNTVAVAFTDGTLVLYALDGPLAATAEVHVDLPRGAIGWDGTRVWWLGEDGTVYAWVPGHAVPVSIHDNEEIFPKHLLISPYRWLSRLDGSMLVSTTHSIVTFMLRDEGHVLNGRVEALLGGATWRAVCKHDQLQWLCERQRPHVVPLGREVMGRLYCAADGTGHFYAASGYGPGFVHTLATLHTIPILNCPSGVNDAIGEEGGGCWLIDRIGDIYFVETTGQCRCAARIGLDDMHGAHLVNCSDILLWVGYSTCFFQESGAVPARTFIFFLKTSGSIPSLKRLGQQLRHPTDGICLCEAYDTHADRVITLWVKQNDGDEIYLLRTGTINEFLSWQLRETVVNGLGPSTFVQGACSANSQFIGVINRAGDMACVSVEQGQVLATLASSQPFTAIASGAEGAAFWLLEARERVYGCIVVGGDHEHWHQ